MTPHKFVLTEIETCRRTRSTELDLSELGLEEIPREVFELAWLEKLNVSGVSPSKDQKAKGIRIIPQSIQQLTALTKFDCAFNQITDLSPLTNLVTLQDLACNSNQISDLSPLSKLTAMQSLSCGFNSIDDLSPLGDLVNIQELYLSSNPVSDLSPLKKISALQKLACWKSQISDLSPLSQLISLQELRCWSNQITDLTPLSQLTALKALDCGSNQIKDLSPLGELLALQSLTCWNNKIRSLSPLKKLTKLRSLICWGNQINNLIPIQDFVISGQLEDLYLYANPVYGIPSELLGEHPNESCEENLRNYWRDLAKHSEKQQKLKVQLIGNGRVGKTTLAYNLKHKHAPSKPPEPTHGIVIEEIQQTLNGEVEPVTLHLWDFGGQEIYHATHRLFLSSDCLYLLLWAEKTTEHQDETRHPISYWLELIHDLGSNSPVILVKNQIDRSDHLLGIPPDLDANMPGASQIQQVVNISAMQYRGLPIMYGAIESVLEELKYRVCVELPSSWLQIQRELEPLKAQQTIPFTHFQQLCTKAGIEHAKWFLNYLHKIGFLFYQQGAFQDQIILDQNWAIKAAYCVFDPKGSRDMITAMQGSFTGQLSRMIWSEVDDTERQIYLDFMHKSGICYEPNYWRNRQNNIPFSEREFIIPALLPKTNPAQSAWRKHSDDWLLEVDYSFLHRSIIERLILRLGETYRSSPWYTGTFCQTEFGDVLLECRYVDATQKNTNTGQLNLHLRSEQNPKRLVAGIA